MLPSIIPFFPGDGNFDRGGFSCPQGGTGHKPLGLLFRAVLTEKVDEGLRFTLFYRIFKHCFTFFVSCIYISPSSD